MGSTNRAADQAAVAEIQRLVLRQGFNELPHLQSTQDDLDLSLIQEFFLQAKKKFDLNAIPHYLPDRFMDGRGRYG